MRRGAALAVAAAAGVTWAAGATGCSGPGKRVVSAEAPSPAPVLPADRILALLPQGAQLVVELDLARLRSNPVIGEVVTRALSGGVPLPGAAAASAGAAGAAGSPPPPPPPLLAADVLVLAAFGVGTTAAATVTLLAGKQPIPDAARVAEGIYAIGPEEWTAQLAQRGAMLDTEGLIRAQPELIALRDRAMPPKAPGASLRVTAQLSFDARVALARQTGLEAAPAQLSIWGDVVDDLVIVVEADAADPGDRRGKQATARLEAALRGALASLAAEPAVAALGLPRSLTGAKLAVRGTWIRAIIAVGPEHLRRVAARASALLPAVPPKAAP
ncbi:MAG TPA: hypothetical protein VNO30_42880 [Kofleriaceae bacterium]|nr:hypothetical protein [Kofleriaceae bacterium]